MVNGKIYAGPFSSFSFSSFVLFALPGFSGSKLNRGPRLRGWAFLLETSTSRSLCLGAASGLGICSTSAVAFSCLCYFCTLFFGTEFCLAFSEFFPPLPLPLFPLGATTLKLSGVSIFVPQFWPMITSLPSCRMILWQFAMPSLTSVPPGQQKYGQCFVLGCYWF